MAAPFLIFIFIGFCMKIETMDADYWFRVAQTCSLIQKVSKQIHSFNFIQLVYTCFFGDRNFFQYFLAEMSPCFVLNFVLTISYPFIGPPSWGFASILIVWQIAIFVLRFHLMRLKMYVEIFSRFPQKTFLTIIVNLFSGLMRGTLGNSIRLLFFTVYL